MKLSKISRLNSKSINCLVAILTVFIVLEKNADAEGVFAIKYTKEKIKKIEIDKVKIKFLVETYPTPKVLIVPKQQEDANHQTIFASLGSFIAGMSSSDPNWLASTYFKFYGINYEEKKTSENPNVIATKNIGGFEGPINNQNWIVLATVKAKRSTGVWIKNLGSEAAKLHFLAKNKEGNWVFGAPYIDWRNQTYIRNEFPYSTPVVTTNVYESTVLFPSWLKREIKLLNPINSE